MQVEQNEEQNWLITACLLVLATVAGAVALIYTRNVVIPFVLAIFIATIVAPIVDVLIVRARVPRPLAVLAAMLVVIGALALVLWMMVSAVQSVAAQSGQYADQFEAMASDMLTHANAWVKELNLGVTLQSEAELVEGFKQNLPTIGGQVATESFTVVRSIVTQTTLTLIFVAFMLAGRDPHVIRKGIYAQIDSKVRRYIVTKVAVSAVTAIIVYIILRVMGLQMASLFALLTFLLNFIPSIGSIIATLLPLPAALAQFGDNWVMVVMVIALPGLVQMTIGNAIEPKLYGEGLELHPVTVLLSLAFWGLLWGIVGMVLAVPITASLRIVLMRFETTRPIGQIMAGDLPDDPDG